MGYGLKTKLAHLWGCLEEGAFIFDKLFKSEREKDFSSDGSDTGVWFIDEIPSSIILSKSDWEGIRNILEHRFTILNPELMFWGQEIEWSQDILSGYTWPFKFNKRLTPIINFDDNSDPKVPWELSRFQYIHLLGKAFANTHKRQLAKEVVNELEHWLKNNPYPYGINWICAMEAAIRSCNWIWGWWFFKDAEAWSEEFNKKFLLSLWQHGKYIQSNLEDKGKFSTNHYLSNVVGLLFIGIMFPCFNEAKEWQNFGKKELCWCMEEMVYPDGVSFENSVAYHRLVLEFFSYSAILCKRNDIKLPNTYWERLEKMFEFVMHYTRPDGKAPMIGDSDDGRFFILSNYYDWVRWDHRYLLSIGAVLFNRTDFKTVASRFYEDALWILGDEGYKNFKQL